MIRILALLVSLLASTMVAPALALSPQATVSLITEDPGREIYLAFGHTAVRVKDPVVGLDRLYNYGTIDPRYLTDPSFVPRFLAGDLQYSLGVSRYRDAAAIDLQYEGRNWVEQVFDLTPVQVQKVYDALEWNALEENRVYAYDFLKDNCSTRVPWILDKALGAGVVHWGKRDTPTNARNLVIEKLQYRPWWRFWSLFALGTEMTAPATDAEVLFLPDELFRSANGATIDGHSLVRAEEQVLTGAPRGSYDEPDSDPAPWLWALVVLAAGLLPPWGLLRRSSGRAVARWFDFTYFFLLGLGGSILVGLTFFSAHAAAHGNWNLIWINPLGFVAAWVVLRKPRPWHRIVWLVLGVPTAAFIALSWLGPQPMVLDHLPILLLTVLRVAGAWFQTNERPQETRAVATA